MLSTWSTIGLSNAILFVDLKKAFDTINHEILLLKLELYGLIGASLKLFTNYLSDRTQFTVINNVDYDFSFKTIGGGLKVLSSAPFILNNINELPKCNFFQISGYMRDLNQQIGLIWTGHGSSYIIILISNKHNVIDIRYLEKELTECKKALEGKERELDLNLQRYTLLHNASRP